MPSLRTTTRVPMAFCAVPTGVPCAEAGGAPQRSRTRAAAPSAAPRCRMLFMALPLLRLAAVIDDADRLAAHRHRGDDLARSRVDDPQVVGDLVHRVDARALAG